VDVDGRLVPALPAGSFPSLLKQYFQSASRTRKNLVLQARFRPISGDILAKAVYIRFIKLPMPSSSTTLEERLFLPGPKRILALDGGGHS